MICANFVAKIVQTYPNYNRILRNINKLLRVNKGDVLISEINTC